MNPIPKALADKFNSNQELFEELKQFIESSSMIKTKNSSFWTFPEFKNTPEEKQDPNKLYFPDPRYYMIGFSIDKPDESENVGSD